MTAHPERCRKQAGFMGISPHRTALTADAVLPTGIGKALTIDAEGAVRDFFDLVTGHRDLGA